MEGAVNATYQHQFLHRSVACRVLLGSFFPLQQFDFLLHGVGLSLGIQKLLGRVGLLRLQLLKLFTALQPPFEGELSSGMTA